LLALQIIRDLVDKGGDIFLDQLARLGVISKVSALAGPSSDDENEEESKPEKVSGPSSYIENRVCFVLKEMCVCVCVCVCVYVYVCIYIHTYKHTYTYILKIYLFI
jgi:hypothetical protein